MSLYVCPVCKKPKGRFANHARCSQALQQKYANEPRVKVLPKTLDPSLPSYSGCDELTVHQRKYRYGGGSRNRRPKDY